MSFADEREVRPPGALTERTASQAFGLRGANIVTYGFSQSSP
jgi:hypothetical protein